MMCTRRASGLLFAGVLLNCGLGIVANRISPVFFLDMAGTALAALALGPWAGVFVGVCANLVLSMVPGMGQYLTYLPVNVVGALVWGTIGRSWLHVFPPTRAQATLGALMRTWGLGLVVGVACAVVAVLVRVEWRWTIGAEFISRLPKDHPTEELTAKVAKDVAGEGSLPSVVLAALELLSTIPDKVLATAVAIYMLASFFPGFAQPYLRPPAGRVRVDAGFGGAAAVAATCAWFVLLWRDLFMSPVINLRHVVAWAVFAGVVLVTTMIGARVAGTPTRRRVIVPVSCDWKELLHDTTWFLGLGYTVFVAAVRHPMLQTETEKLLRDGLGVASLLVAVGFIAPFLARHFGAGVPAGGAPAAPVSTPGESVAARPEHRPGPPQRICVLCGSVAGADPRYEHAARRLGVLLGRRACTLVYGGTHLGLMDAVADEAVRNGAAALGIIPEHLAALRLSERAHGRVSVVPTVGERLRQMELVADAFVALPGGLGTLEELFSFLSLAQLDMLAKPVALLNVCGYYDLLLQHLRRCVDEGFLEPHHLELLIVEQEPELLLERLARFRPKTIRKWA